MIRRGSTIAFTVDETAQDILKRYAGCDATKYKRIYTVMTEDQKREVRNMKREDRLALCNGHDPC